MIAGHLRIKRDIYQMVLNYTDTDGKRKTIWRSTGLPTKGNKKRAEQMLMDARKNFSISEQQTSVQVSNSAEDTGEILFADFMLDWLEVVRPTIKKVTFASYSSMVRTPIEPYFRKLGITLQKLNQRHIQDFYTEQLKRVKASSVIHYHANIHKALKYAVKMDMIPSNPADKVERPKKDLFVGSFLDSEEFSLLYEAVKGTNLEMGVIFGGFYGLRRSEVIGLKWSAIDYQNDTITINHTVTDGFINGRHEVFAEDSTKSKSSHRVLPLMANVKVWLQDLKKRQEANKKLCGRSYCQDYLEYIYVDAMGYRMKASYISGQFSSMLKKNGLRKIRFHDLRHTCASMMMAQGVPMKQIQEWLGHSDFSTTANIYAHLDYTSKLTSASSLAEGYGINKLIPMPEPSTKVEGNKRVSKEKPALTAVTANAGCDGSAIAL